MNRRYKPTLFCLLLLSAVPIQSAVAGWLTQWIDPFDGTGVDWNNWTAQTQANYNNEIQCYTDDDSTVNQNYLVAGGTLTIIARRQPSTFNCATIVFGNPMKQWTSGRLNSKDKAEFQYGRLEARIRMLDTGGGSWPAFWMLENRIAEQPIAGDNDSVNWPFPGAGEIDVWEWTSNDPNRYITNFYNNSGGCISGNAQFYNYPNGVLDVQQWHDYAIEWDADQARFYIDDNLVRTQNLIGCGQYQEPMFVLINVAMGGTLGGMVDPALTEARMEIDYVAHCTATTSNSATRCNEATPRGSDLVIFEDVERADWAAWDSLGSSPMLVVDSDMNYAESMEFTIGGAAVVGFTTRAPDAVGGMTFDASTFATTGTIEFDLKMTTPPLGGVMPWKLKVESTAAATAAEVDLSSSREGHATPLLNTWQRYTFDLTDLQTAGLDLSEIDLVMVFPEFGMGTGAVFRLDNLAIRLNAASMPPPAPGGGPAPTSSGGGSSGGGGLSTGPGLLLALTVVAILRRRLRQPGGRS